MKNNKGFTLIELLVTIALIAMLVIIAVPTSIKFIERGKNQQYEILESQILSAANKYYIKHKHITCIELSNLVSDIDDKFLEDDVVMNPTNNNVLEKKVIVSINEKNVKFYLEDGLDC